MACGIPSLFLAEISEVLRASDDATQTRSGLITPVQTCLCPRWRGQGGFIRYRKRARPLSLYAVEFGIFRHARRPQYSAAFGLNKRLVPWTWVASDIQNKAGDGQWMHARCLTEIPGILRRAFGVMGDCRFPPYASSAVAEKWFDVRRLISGMHGLFLA